MWPIKVLKKAERRTLMAAVMCTAEWQALQVVLSEGSGVEKERDRVGGGQEFNGADLRFRRRDKIRLGQFEQSPRNNAMVSILYLKE